MPHGVSDELGAVFRTDVSRCRVDAGDFPQHGHYFLGLAAPDDTDGQAESAVFIDHFQEFELMAIGYAVVQETMAQTWWRRPES